MELINKILSMSPKEFERFCNQMSELIKKKKRFWGKILEEMSDEEFKNKVCMGSKDYVCLQFQNEKYFMNLSDEKPQIKILDHEINFPITCPKYEIDCKIKKAIKETKLISEEEEEF
jgi:hypothetical protein